MSFFNNSLIALNSAVFGFVSQEEADEWVDTRLQRYQGDQDYKKLNTDWQEEAFQNSFIRNANISFTGGTEKTKSFLSASYNNSDGIIRSNSLERISMRANIDHDVNDWLDVGLNLGYTSTVIDRISGDNSFTTPFPVE